MSGVKRLDDIDESIKVYRGKNAKLFKEIKQNKKIIFDLELEKAKLEIETRKKNAKIGTVYIRYENPNSPSNFYNATIDDTHNIWNIDGFERYSDKYDYFIIIVEETYPDNSVRNRRAMFSIPNEIRKLLVELA